jgi:hypothetical protein
MAIDTSIVNQKLSINTGEVLFEEGKNTDSLNILHEGSITYEKKLNNKRLPFCEVSGRNLTPGVTSLFTTGKYPFTIKASSNCVISTYKVSMDTVRKTISSKMAIGSMIAKTLFMENTELLKRANFIKNHRANLNKLNDNLSIAYYFLTPSAFPDINLASPQTISEVSGMSDPVMDTIRKNLKSYLLNGGSKPEKLSVDFLKQNKGGYLSKDYPSRVEINDQEAQLIRKIIGLKPETTNQIFTEDITILLTMCEKLAEYNALYSDEYSEVIENFSEDMYALCGGQNSLLEKYYLVLDLASSGISEIPTDVLAPIMDYVSFSVNSYLNTYKSNFILEFPDQSPSILKFQETSSKLAKSLKEETGGGIAEAGPTITIDHAAIKKELENSASKILTFAGTPIEKIKEFSSLVLKLKSMKNPLDPEPDARKIRRNLTKIYWEVYEKSLQKYITGNKKVPKQIKMLLLYGFMDETLLEPEHIEFLFLQADREERGVPGLSTFDGTEWLEGVYNRKIITSIDGLGQTFFEKVKMETKDQVFKKESDLPPELDNGQARLNYELYSMYGENVKLTTGNPTTHLPILTKYQIAMPLDKSFVSSKMIQEALTEILAIDYTAFYREVIYNDGELGIRSELIQTNVVPDFIFVPSIGDKIMMWQVLSTFRGAGSKESKGRIVIPRFVTSNDLKTTLIEAIGSFRWELTKEILGPDWNNPSIPSITSNYMDYLQFYKKSKDLSIEQKEKITEEFRRFRSDKDKFINDYVGWIKSESEGIQKLNRVVRTIFYRHIPFAPAVRERVCKMPAYIEIHNKFVNIRNRDYKERENKYRKYMNTLGSLPKKLQDNLDYYKV